jgi:hypothetical protein
MHENIQDNMDLEIRRPNHAQEWKIMQMARHISFAICMIFYFLAWFAVASIIFAFSLYSIGPILVVQFPNLDILEHI